jgi:MFS family permease
MIARFDLIKRDGDVAFYYGVLAGSVSAASGVSNPLWGWFSDRIRSRKLLLLGFTLGSMVAFLLFGVSGTYGWVSYLSLVTQGILKKLRRLQLKFCTAY